MEMYNLKGQKIKTLVSQYLDAGDYSVVWDGNNDLNLPVSSGVYLYRLQTDTDHVIQKCILLK